MGKYYASLEDTHVKVIRRQRVFFVGTAPLSGSHHVNVSPKGFSQGTFAVLGPNQVCYLDLTGSGSETIAHLKENGRITIMFVNLEEGAPTILRMFGTGRVILARDAPPHLKSLFGGQHVDSPGFRALILVDIHRVSSSCGYAVPVYKYCEDRSILHDFTDKKGPDGMADYRILKNSFSIDGMPSLTRYDPAAPPVKPVLENGYFFGYRASALERIVPRSLVVRFSRGWAEGLSGFFSVNTALGLALGVGLCRLAQLQQRA